MNLKLTFIFAALCMASAYGYPKDVTSDGPPFVEYLKIFVQLFEAVVGELLEGAPDLIDTIDDSWPEMQHDVVETSRNILAMILDLLNMRLTTWAEKSGEAGKKLAQCVEDARDDIVAIPVDFFDNVTKCNGDAFVSFIKVLGPIVQDLTDEEEDAKRAADRINDCYGNDMRTTLCVLNVISDLIDVTKIVVVKTDPHIEPVAQQWKQFIETTRQCRKDNRDSYDSAVGDLLQKVSTCVAG
ncbi:uncharacterized protein [Diabrotica undecimpunctata]|uniref:uncharacterized protein n=1 Tax=Diabrotica undecimpunctata TaxID=50387 RepID=UPI003B64044B